jgi:hypothetical protein
MEFGSVESRHHSAFNIPDNARIALDNVLLLACSLICGNTACTRLIFHHSFALSRT